MNRTRHVFWVFTYARADKLSRGTERNHDSLWIFERRPKRKEDTGRDTQDVELVMSNYRIIYSALALFPEGVFSPTRFSHCSCARLFAAFT